MTVSMRQRTGTRKFSARTLVRSLAEKSSLVDAFTLVLTGCVQHSTCRAAAKQYRCGDHLTQR